jgi:hypothetical protein
LGLLSFKGKKKDTVCVFFITTPLTFELLIEAFDLLLEPLKETRWVLGFVET